MPFGDKASRTLPDGENSSITFMEMFLHCLLVGWLTNVALTDNYYFSSATYDQVINCFLKQRPVGNSRSVLGVLYGFPAHVWNPG